MTRPSILLLFAILASGCAAERKLVEHRTGWMESSRSLPVDATCTLVANNGTYSRSPIEVRRGADVGFRRDQEGRLVAFAGNQGFPVEENQAEWRFRRLPSTAWDRFADRTRSRSEQVASSARMLVLWPFIIINGSITGDWP